MKKSKTVIIRNLDKKEDVSKALESLKIENDIKTDSKAFEMAIKKFAAMQEELDQYKEQRMKDLNSIDSLKTTIKILTL